MSAEADTVYAGVAVHAAEAAALRDIEREVSAAGLLEPGAPIPGLVLGTSNTAAPVARLGFTARDGTVVGLALRDVTWGACRTRLGASRPCGRWTSQATGSPSCRRRSATCAISSASCSTRTG